MKRDAIKRRPLSDSTLANLEPEDKDYRERDTDKLYFLVQKTGKKSWQLRYKKENGCWSWKGIGAYPAISGRMARLKANELLELLAKGEVLKTKNQIKQSLMDVEHEKFGFLMNEWLDTRKNVWNETTFNKAKKSIDRHIIPKFGERNFSEISSKEWFDFFQGMQRELNIYTQIKKLVSYCRNVYDWAKFQAKINFNPIDGMTKHLDKSEGGSMKFVEIHELPQLIIDIRTHHQRKLAIGLELLALLFPRPIELRFATWSQFDFEKKIWTKPSDVMKTGISHAVPLPTQAITLLKELKQYRTESELLFAGRNSLNQPISDNTFNMALNRMGYKNRQNPHGFRHIASTALNNEFSDKEQVIESCLAHMKKGVKGAYDKGSHLEERAGIMQWWADYLDKITGEFPI